MVIETAEATVWASDAAEDVRRAQSLRSGTRAGSTDGAEVDLEVAIEPHARSQFARLKTRRLCAHRSLGLLGLSDAALRAASFRPSRVDSCARDAAFERSGISSCQKLLRGNTFCTANCKNAHLGYP